MNLRKRHTTLVSGAVLLFLVAVISGCGARGGSARSTDVPAESAPATAASQVTATATTPVTDTPLPDSTAPDSPLPTATAPSSPLATQQEPVYTYEIIAEYPYDENAWTQGLVYTNDLLYVGTGLHGESTLRTTDLETGDILKSVELPEEYFGEGVTVFGDKVYQLTWQEHEGFIYDESELSELSTFTYTTEGWGLTHDGEQLIMSDGTANLYFRDPETLEEKRQVLVTSSLGPLRALNELEYVDGEVFANVWTTDWIARIDPETGKVLGWIDMSGLLSAEDRANNNPDVLNGIAYDAENDRLFVTGKLWPKLFEVKLIPAD